MVNCKNCGAPLSLNDAYCPHCGTPNPEAQEHLRKLKKLDKEVETAKQEVHAEVKKTKKGYGLLIIMAMLLLANLVAFVMHEASYEIAEKIIASRMSEQEIRSTLDELLDEGEYIELDLFMDKYNLSYRDYEEYMGIQFLADQYNRIMGDLTNYLYATETYNDPLIKTCEDIVNFKDEYASLKRRDMSEKTAFHVEKINEEVDSVLRTYLDLTDEDIEKIDGMNSSALLILVNERLTK
jgi:hypothetical protein